MESLRIILGVRSVNFLAFQKFITCNTENADYDFQIHPAWRPLKLSTHWASTSWTTLL